MGIDHLLHDICKSMTDDTIEAIARHIATETDFGVVQSVSKGGQRLADALEKHAEWDAPFQVLLIDDVFLSTGSMEAAKAAQPVQVHEDDIVGYVIFATDWMQSWVNAVFMTEDGGSER